MKIKEIFESAGSETYNHSMWFTFNERITNYASLQKQILKLKSEFKKYGYLGSKGEIKVGFPDSYTIDVFVYDIVKVTIETFDNIYSSIIDELEYYGSNTRNDIDQGNQSLEVFGVPSKPIYFNAGGGDVYVRFNPGDSIQKSKWYENFKEASVIVLTNLVNLEGGLLSILKIPKSFNVEIIFNRTGNKVSKLEAIKIINKYLESRDLLGCQDELIENGLSEYAKL